MNDNDWIDTTAVSPKTDRIITLKIESIEVFKLVAIPGEFVFENNE